MENRAVVQVNMQKIGRVIDLDVPLEITAAELLEGISHAYGLGIDTEDASKCYVKMENPIALVHGKRSLADFGMHEGSVISITE